MAISPADQDENGGQEGTTLLTTYLPETNSYTTKRIRTQDHQGENSKNLDDYNIFDLEDGNIILHNGTAGHILYQKEQILARRKGSLLQKRRDSLINYLSHAFGNGPKTNYIFGYILGLNLLMSIFNTVLLSFVVKTMQEDEARLFGGKYLKFEGGPNGASSILELPAVLTKGKYISSNLIRHSNHQPGPFIIENWRANDEREKGAREPSDILLLADSGELSSKHHHQDERQLASFSADQTGLVDHRMLHHFASNSDYILLKGGDRAPKSNDHFTRGNMSKIHNLANNGQLEIGTNSLVLKLLDPISTETNRKTRHSGNKISSPAEKTLSSKTLTNFKTTRTKASEGHSRQKEHQHRGAKSWLEFDGGELSITLPLLSKFDISSLSRSSRTKQKAHHLLVNDRLKCGKDLSGTLENHFDIQSSGNMSCKSGKKLRIVSKSASLNLIAREQVELISSQVEIDSSRVYLLDGIEFFDELKVFDGDEQRQFDNGNQPNGDPGLVAYNLMLVDGALMGVSV